MLSTIIGVSTKIIILLISSLLIRQVAIWGNQRWLNTFSHTTTLLLLPVITYVITSVISGNIALSLGLVGALSIVRFRNPVKSPFELSMYFLMIALGIGMSVSIKWPVLLTAISIFVILSITISNFIYLKITKKPLLNTSFSEGNSLNVAEITTSKSNNDLLHSSYLINYLQTSNKHTYRLAHHDKNYLINLIQDLQNNGVKLENIRFSVG